MVKYGRIWSNMVNVCGGSIIYWTSVCESYTGQMCVWIIYWTNVCVTHILDECVCDSYTGRMCVWLIYWTNVCVTHILDECVCDSYTGRMCVWLIYWTNVCVTHILDKCVIDDVLFSESITISLILGLAWFDYYEDTTNEATITLTEDITAKVSISHRPHDRHWSWMHNYG